MSDASATVAHVRVAQEALDEATQRQRVAVQAVIDFALKAVLEGDDLDPIMDACGFREEESTGLAALLPYVGTPRQRFAAWMGNVLAERILKGRSEQ